MARNLKIAAVAAGTMAAASLLSAAAVGVRRKYCLQVLRTRGGMARVHAVEAADGEQIRVLSAGGVYQSATYLGERRMEPVFTYYRAFDAAFAAEKSLGHPVKNMLMIGGGGFAYPKHVLTAHEGVHMDVAEVDLSVVRAARRWFFLDELEAHLANPQTAQGNSMRIIEADGRELLETGAGVQSRAKGSAAPAEEPARRFVVDGPCGTLRVLRDGELSLPVYDAIVNDAFLGREPAACLATVEAARAVRARLAAGGVYLANVVSGDHGRDLGFLRDEVATLRQVFTHVHVLQTSDAEFGGEDNYLLIATDGELEFEKSIAYDDEFLGVPLRDRLTV